MAINSKQILYKVTGDDEAYTPAYGVEPILKYIPNNITVWCPFDTEDSFFVKLIREYGKDRGITVVHSHISEGKDFFEYEPEQWDIIISNPPFKNKRKFFEKAIAFEKPFALLMTNTWLNDSAPKKLFEFIDLQLLMFDKRIRFDNPYGKNNGSPTFSSSYYCRDFLPKQIIMEMLEIPKN